MNWQPIETAPKDGTIVLVASAHRVGERLAGRSFTPPATVSRGFLSSKGTAMQYEFREIDQWPGKLTTNRRRAPFAASHLSTLKLLERELKHLQARSVVIQAAVSSQDIRNDGMLRSTARPRHPGIILSFETVTLGPLSYPCDTFDDWTQNLRAIALALEALRRVERYGVTRRGEQYRGWAKLPAPGAMSQDEALSVVLTAAKWNDYRVYQYQEARRAALTNAHPDTGGSVEKFKKVMQAVEILDKVKT